MQKIRDLYARSQRSATGDLSDFNYERMRKIFAHAKKQQSLQASGNDTQQLNEANFYHQQFKNIYDFTKKSAEEEYKRDRFEKQIRNIMKEDYDPDKTYSLNKSNINQSVVPANLTATNQRSKSSVKEKEEKVRQSQRERVRSSDKERRQEGRQGSWIDLIGSFFQEKEKEVQKSKLGLQSVLKDMPRAPKKYAVKASAVRSDRNKIEEKKLHEQIADLRKKIQTEERNTQQSRHKQKERSHFESQIRALSVRVDILQSANQRLRSEQGQGPKTWHVQPEQVSDPTSQIMSKLVGSIYHISYCSNDMEHLKTIYHPPSEQVKKEKDDRVSRADHQLMEQLSRQSQWAKEEEKHNFVPFDEKSYDMHKLSSIPLRVKMCCFRDEVVLYRGKDFELAVRRMPSKDLGFKSVSIFIHNKQDFPRQAKITYEYWTQHHEINVLKRAGQVPGRAQRRAQVSVKLLQKGRADLDIMVRTKLIYNQKQIKFVLPTMFIHFSAKNPPVQDILHYSSVRVVPLHCFSSVYLAEQMIPLLERIDISQYDKQVVTMAKVFAFSAANEGWVYLRWLRNGELEIETLQPWKYYLGYLMSIKV